MTTLHPDPVSLAAPFSFPIRVYWEDTDGGGVVYHARYLHFLERVRSEWLRAQGIGQQGMSEREDLMLVVREMQLDFLKPARLDDLLVATMQVSVWRRASFEVVQELLRGDDCLLKAKVRIACLKASEFKPRPLPAWLAGAQPAGER